MQENLRHLHVLVGVIQAFSRPAPCSFGEVAGSYDGCSSEYDSRQLCVLQNNIQNGKDQDTYLALLHVYALYTVEESLEKRI